MDDDRVGLLVQCFRAGERAALDALAGIMGSALIGGFGDCETLQADAEAASFIITNMAAGRGSLRRSGSRSLCHG